MSRKDFLSLSAIAGVSTLVGSSTLMTSCGEKGPVYTPLKQPGEYYITVLNAKAADGKATKIIVPSEIQNLAGLVPQLSYYRDKIFIEYIRLGVL